jgi:hypothetical protein
MVKNKLEKEQICEHEGKKTLKSGESDGNMFHFHFSSVWCVVAARPFIRYSVDFLFV